MAGPAYVTDFLETLGHQAGGLDPDFADHVRERLELGEREYNGSYRQKPVAKLIREAREEEADVPAWLVLVIERSYEEEAAGKLTPEEGQAVRICAVNWAARSQALWREMTALLDDIS